MKAADDFIGHDGLQPGRGGFLATSRGVRYITDADGATVKGGARKGEVGRSPYSDTSNFGTLIENRGWLEKRSERKIIEGLASMWADNDADPLLHEYRRGVAAGRNAIADKIIARAKAAANIMLAADRGTHVHTITEHYDRQQGYKDLVPAGVALGISEDRQIDVVTAWAKMLTAYGLEVLAVEASVVDDEWRCAGTLDRLVRCTRDLRFALPAGEVVTIPAGTVVVLDIKTGSLRRTAAIQLASYAHSVPYDTATEQRGEWDFTVSTEHALIAHIDIEAGTIDLVYVDIVAGRDHGGRTVVHAKAWEARNDLFSVAILGDDPAAAPTLPPVTAPSSGSDHHTGDTDANIAGSAQLSLQPNPDHSIVATAKPVEIAGAGSDAESPVASPAATEGTPGQLPATAPVSTRTPADEQAAVRDRGVPDEGDAVGDPTFDALQAAYMALPATGRTWITALTVQANQGGVPFHTKGHRTRRRWEIVRALVLIAAEVADDPEWDVDAHVRNYLEPIIGDCAQFPSVPVGHLLGSLCAREAAQFSGLVDGTYALAYDGEGRAALTAA